MSEAKVMAMRTHGYYVNRKTGIYHDPSRYNKNTGNPCPMLQYWRELEWVPREPTGKGFRPCKRCPSTKG